nr:integrase, catalytic region, zinc finger, CCHC-type, peptidase aspartic, catalytic [Tanacetum cinerariifolium]
LAEKGVPLQAEQSDWLADTDEEIDKHELEAHYSYMAKIQKVPTTDSGTDSEPLEQVQYDVGYNVFANEIQHSEKSEYISNTCVVETDDSNVISDSSNMSDNDIQNDQNAVECDDEQTSRTLGESNSIQDSYLVALKNKQTEFEKYKNLNNCTVDYAKLKTKLNETLGLLAQKDIDIKEGLVKEKTKVIMDLKLKEEKDIDKMISMEKQLKFLNEIVYKRNQTIQTIHMLALKGPAFNGRSTFSNLMYLNKAQSEIPCLYAIPNDQFDPANRLVPDREETTKGIRQSKPFIVTHKTNIGRPQLRSTQMTDKVMSNNSQVKDKKTKVEDHPRISSISNNKKFITMCNDSLKSRTSNVNDVCATCGKCLVDSDHFAYVTKMLNYVNASTKKPNVVPISTRKPKGHANKYVATPPKKTVASESTTQKFKSYYRMMYEKTTKIVQLIIFIVDVGCTNHMTSNLTLLCNFVEKYLVTVRFGNVQFALILGYGDLVQVNITINSVYYVKGLNHNLFSVGQFCDTDLKVAFQKSTCFVRDLQGNDLLTDNRGSDLYTISLQETTSLTPICLMAKASPTQAWLWHRRLSHRNFDYINLFSKKDVMVYQN